MEVTIVFLLVTSARSTIRFLKQIHVDATDQFQSVTLSSLMKTIEHNPYLLTVVFLSTLTP